MPSFYAQPAAGSPRAVADHVDMHVDGLVAGWAGAVHRQARQLDHGAVGFATA